MINPPVGQWFAWPDIAWPDARARQPLRDRGRRLPFSV